MNKDHLLGFLWGEIVALSVVYLWTHFSYQENDILFIIINLDFLCLIMVRYYL